MSKGDAAVLLGVPIDRTPLDEAVSDAINAIEGLRSQLVFACANPHSLVEAQSDSEFRRALCHADLTVADGIGVILMARLARIPIGPRITGSDFFFAVLDALRRRGGGRVFFFGSSPQVIERIRERFVRDYGELTLCGTLSPPYRAWTDDENAAMVAQINAAAPDVLWVAMTAPKQEKWVDVNRGALSARVIGSIGAVFDFYAGTHPRAPRWMCKLGLEWLYRLLREPRRMWRRTLVSSPKFVGLMIWRHVLGRPWDGRSLHQ
jgi:N-acetylglucosaminyldiphosphoundecaprenol N-acetyl-beta-D-mannosaminyltransferase